MTLTQRLQQIDTRLDPEWMRTADDRELQEKMAPVLRELAITRLKEGVGRVGENFANAPKEVFTALDYESREDYLSKQGKEYVWADSHELQTLAEMLDITLYVRERVGHFPPKLEAPQILHHSGSKKPSEFTVLYEGKVHWSHPDRITLSDGNCGYNFFAQIIADALRAEHQAEQKPLSRAQSLPDLSAFEMEVDAKPLWRSNSTGHVPATTTTATLAAKQGFFADKQKVQEIIESQKQIAERHYPNLLAEPELEMPVVDSETQKQIDADYQYALEIAAEELAAAKSSNYR